MGYSESPEHVIGDLGAYHSLLPNGLSLVKSVYSAFCLLSFARRFRCAAAIRARVAALRVNVLAPSGDGGTAPVIHLGGLPRRFPRPLAIRSKTKIACSTPSRSSRSSLNIFSIFIWSMIAWRDGRSDGAAAVGAGEGVV